MLRHLLAFTTMLTCPLPLGWSQQQNTMPDMPGMEMGIPSHDTPPPSPAKSAPATPLASQTTLPSMPAMSLPMDGMPGMMKPANDLRGAILNHSASGTTVEPPSTRCPC